MLSRPPLTGNKAGESVRNDEGKPQRVIKRWMASKKKKINSIKEDFCFFFQDKNEEPKSNTDVPHLENAHQKVHSFISALNSIIISFRK